LGLSVGSNLAAFLAVIRRGEGTSDPDGYRRHFGGKLFDSFADHPREAITLGTYTSTAAGAYQILSRTWDEIRAAGRYGPFLADFSPASQDEAARRLIARRGALEDVLAGRLEAAIAKCNKEWASLPGSPYGQPTTTIATCRKVYEAAGGTYAPEAPVIPAFIAAAIPALLEAAPALVRLFGSGSEVSERNAKAAEAVAEVAKAVTQADTIEGAVKAIQNDPARAAEFREAVHLNMTEWLGVLKDAAASDDASADRATERAIKLAGATGGRWLYLLGGVAIAVVVASYAITAGVLFTSSTFSDETKALLLGQVVIFGFVTVLGFLFGSNIQNRISAERERQ
jgi:muramidase (phage lysozyme)